MVVLRSMSFVMTPRAVSKPIDKKETSKSNKTCACEGPSPTRRPHDELHHAQAFSGNVKALVGLLRVLRVAELAAPPPPASGAPEEAQVLHQSRRKRPRPPTLLHDPRKCARAQDETHSQRSHASRKRAEHRREHVKYPSTWSAWRLCAGDGDACRGHAD